MTCARRDMNAMLEMIRELYDGLPFHRLLGLKVTDLGPDAASLRFSTREDLIGNYVQGILHGGVISAVLDATGGMTATASAVCKMEGLTDQEIAERVSKIGTIDMRVDYLRPGRGSEFFTSGTVLRTGRKLAVTRMELKNQDEMLIAAGTAAYLVG